MNRSAEATPLLQVEGLTVGFGRYATARPVVSGVSFAVHAGECVAIVGESGSGKSVTARSLLGLAGPGAAVSAERLEFSGTPLPAQGARAWRQLRGRSIGLVLQDALVSLDPLRPVGREIDDALRLHTTLSLTERRARVVELLEQLGMPEPEIRAGQRSGELSGGLRQRALIASAIAARPPLLIADEPTTALDVTVQQQVLALLRAQRDDGVGLLLISHDLAVVAAIADRVLVMRAGVVVEEGPTAEILDAPTHPYTRSLLAAVPSGAARGERLSAADRGEAPPVAPHRANVDAPPALEFDAVSRSFARRGAAPLLAVDRVSLAVGTGRTLGLVGESGSGKTTLARMALGLTLPDSGSVRLLGERWSDVPERERRGRRAQLGAVYQDALSSFDPRLTVAGILNDALRAAPGARWSGVPELLEAVGLSDELSGRRPLHLSGGQRQRVSIARALAATPQVLVCDEPVSALDVSVQAQILDLLDELQAELGLSMLFISHDLGVVQHMSDEVAVMQGGRIVESGTAQQIFASPQHEYTRRLLDATPQLPGEEGR